MMGENMMNSTPDHRHDFFEVIDRIKKDIEIGVYKEKEKLPTEFELSKALEVSRDVIKDALRILEEENIVTRRHGVGIFVNPKPVFTSGIEELFSVTEMIERAGKTPGTIYLTSTFLKPTEEDMNRFKCSEEEELFNVERIRTADKEPVAYCVDLIPKTVLPATYTHEAESLFELLGRDAGKNISYAVTQIEPLGFSEKVSPALECDPETALLVLKQMHYDENDEPVLFSSNYFRADKFSFHVLRRR